MFISRSSLAVGLALALTATVSAAPNRSRYSIEGTVVRVHHVRSPQGAGSIAVRLGQRHHYGRNGTTTAAIVGRSRRQGGQTMTFTVNASTRVERLSQGGNRGSRATRATLQAIRTGERVRVFPGSGQQHAARAVVILSHSSNRLGSRRSFRNGSYRRHFLAGNHLLSRHGQRRHVHTNQLAVAHPVAAKVVKHQVKQIVKNHKTILPKHNPTHTHSTNHPHSSGHSHKPSSSHHKR